MLMQLRNMADVLAETSSSVRVLLNSTITINTLPPELLARIFSLCATEEVRHGHYSFHPFRLPSARAAFRLTEVCKHWRNVALSTATLWSGIMCGPREHTPFERYMHLSRSSALHLIVTGDVETVAELFQDQPSRVRHLLLLDMTENWTRRRDPRDLLAVVAPDLLSCELDLQFWPRHGLPEHSYSLFSGYAHDLRELTIHSTKIIPTDEFPSLTHLMLDNIVGIPSLPHILALLDRCPRLEEVFIRSNRDIALLPNHPPHPISLSRLRRIALFIQHSVWLISHIVIPRKCLIRIDNIPLDEALILTQSPLCEQLNAEQLTRVSISAKSRSPLTRGYNTEFSVDLADERSESGLFLVVIAPSSVSREYMTLALSNMLRAPIFSHVLILWAVRHPTSFVLTPAILHALPTLTTLGVVFDDRVHITDFKDLLVVAQPEGKSKYPTACPSLGTLCLRNYRGTDANVETIREIVESRAWEGLRVRRLAIESPEPSHAWKPTALRTFVDELVIRARLDGEAQLPKEWRDEAGSVDNGLWPDWTRG